MTLQKSLFMLVASASLTAGCSSSPSEPAAPHAEGSSAPLLAADKVHRTKAVRKGAPKAEIGVVDDLMAVYSAYQAVSQILQSTATTADPSAQIVAQLNDIEGQMATIESNQQALIQALANLAYQDLRASYLSTMQNVQTAVAQAQTASQQLNEWVATGKTKSRLLAEADNNSQLAANTLRQSSFYYRPPSVAGASDVFDLRQVLVSYLYALTVRTAVIALEDPSFRCPGSLYEVGNCVMPYQGEFQAHLAWLEQLPSLNQPNIRRESLINGDWQSYQVCSFAIDGNSGFSSAIDNLFPAPSQPTCTETWFGNPSQRGNALAYLSFWDNWNVEEEMGIHVIQRTAQTVALDATQDFWMPLSFCFPLKGHPCPPPFRPVGPLVSSDGRCLSNGTTFEGVFYPALTLATCDHSAAQTWQTAPARGQTGQVSLADQSGCIELPEWDSGNSPDIEPCSGSSGEQFTVGTKNELSWARDESLCLTPTGDSVMLAPCNGSPEQHWARGIRQ